MKKDRYEKMRHYIFLNKYGMFPYFELPHSYKAAVKSTGWDTSPAMAFCLADR